MKLATALSERSDLQNKISELTVRLQNNAKVQEGDVPAENPTDLLIELDAKIVRLEELISRINLTNSVITIDGKTLTEFLIAGIALNRR